MRISLTLTLLLLLPGLASAQDPLADQLRKAIVEQEVHQDLGKAILGFQAIVRQYDESRAAAGTALFRLAECLRKQGRRDEAVAAYSRVAREFAAMPALATASVKQLSETYGIKPGPSVTMPPSEMGQAEALRRQHASLVAELGLLRGQLEDYQRRVEIGLMSATDQQIIKLKRELLQLERQLADIEARVASLRKPEPKR